MTADISNNPKFILPVWISHLVLGLAGALAVYAVVAAPEMLRSAERLRTEQIQQEDRDTCTRLKMPLGTDGFTACAAGLMEVRRRQHERTLAHAAGLP